VTSHHATFHPNQVALLSPSGKLLGEYWHSGRLPNLEIVDLDGDGTPEILLGGVSTGYRSATLVALDPAAVRGASAEKETPEDQIVGFAPATEKARLLFPRTCINRVPDRYNAVGWLTVRPKQVRGQVWERRVPASSRPSITYTLDWNPRVTAVTASDRPRSLHHELEASRASSTTSSPSRRSSGWRRFVSCAGRFSRGEYAELTCAPPGVLAEYRRVPGRQRPHGAEVGDRARSACFAAAGRQGQRVGRSRRSGQMA
jgi:hypothetical protein